MAEYNGGTNICLGDTGAVSVTAQAISQHTRLEQQELSVRHNSHSLSSARDRDVMHSRVVGTKQSTHALPARGMIQHYVFSSRSVPYSLIASTERSDLSLSSCYFRIPQTEDEQRWQTAACS